jgi:hypothetical protein
MKISDSAAMGMGEELLEKTREVMPLDGRLKLPARIRQEVSSRDPAGKRPLLLLMDGQESLWKRAGPM